MRLPSSTIIQLLLQILLVCLLQRPSFAVKKSYVVYLGAHSHGPALSSSFVDFNQVTQSHYEFLESYLGSHNTAKDSIFYSYTRHINGFAATLEEEVAAEIAKHPKVLSVFKNSGRKLHTTRSWEFMGLEHKGIIPSTSIWKKARFGEGVIIGNLDTGVWPESNSFSEEGLGPIPSKWRGICDNGVDHTFRCNSSSRSSQKVSSKRHMFSRLSGSFSLERGSKQRADKNSTSSCSGETSLAQAISSRLGDNLRKGGKCSA